MGLVMSNESYNWSDDNSELAILEQRAIAIYENSAGHIVIRQKALDGEDDSIIIVKAQNVTQLTLRLNGEAEAALAEMA